MIRDTFVCAKGAAAAVGERRALALARHDAEEAAERERAARSRPAPARERAPEGWLLPVAVRPQVAGAGPPAWRTLTAYIRGTLIVALIDAVFIGVGIYFLGVPLAVPIAVVIFLASFVPLIGAIASGALAVIVALVTQGVFTALMTLLVVLLVQQIEGHILQPFILGRAVRIHPLAVALSVATGGLIAGIGPSTHTTTSGIPPIAEASHSSTAPPGIRYIDHQPKLEQGC